MTNRLMLISEIDGVLLGSTTALGSFIDWMEFNRDSILLTYATGRTTREVRGLVRSAAIPIPDFVIGSAGTEIEDFLTGETDEAWRDASHEFWNIDKVRRVVGLFPEASPRPRDCQSAVKASYFLPNATPRQLLEIECALQYAEIDAEVLYAGNMFLDVLPLGVDKGTAASRLLKTLQFPRERVLACGSSRHDVPLFQEGFRGVLVANAYYDGVRRQPFSNVHRARRTYADGLLEGIEHWRLLPTDVTASRRYPFDFRRRAS